VRLDLALIRVHPELSRRRAREVIEKGQVDVGGRTVREPGAEVAEAAAIRFDPNRKARRRVRSSLPLLHEDEWLVIVDKPAGLLSVPTAAGGEREDTALARVLDYARHRHPRRPYAAAVHRLDRDTSGALAFALQPEARAALRDLFRAHRIERRYVALVEGAPRQEAGEVDAALFEAYEGGRRRVARRGEPAREARTRWSVRERFAGAALLDVELGTGRQHQIRVHLAHIGLPVLGDPVYRGPRAGRPPVTAPRQMLHGRHLAFRHPFTGERVSVESPLPDDVERAIAALRRLPPRRNPADRH
jgi:23S rRNA pseudouridine1911/1915/1917 synthase